MTDKLFWGEHDATKSKLPMGDFISILLGLVVVCLIAALIIWVRGKL